MTPLNHYRPTFNQHDGWWYLNKKTCDLWQSLNVKLTNSIKVISNNLLVELKHCEPSWAIAYGFLHGHRSKWDLEVSLRASQHAFIHRLAYLSYLISCRYKWDTPDLYNQPWWIEFVKKCGQNWVDSVWDAVCGQWDTRNFVGVVVHPSQASVRWL